MRRTLSSIKFQEDVREMSRIPNYPSDLREEHSDWHMSRSIPMGERGSGLDFLVFHHDFIQDFHQWYDNQPFANQAAVAPWTEIPSEFKTREFGWNARLAAAEDRIVSRPESFASLDQLGIFIETRIHPWLHRAAAEFYDEPVLTRISSANLSDHFYQIHGLIDSWGSSWLQDVWFGS